MAVTFPKQSLLTKVGQSPRNVISVKGVSIKAVSPIFFTDAGMVTVVRPDLRNAEVSISVTVSGITMEVRDLQPKNAELLILVMGLRKVTLLSLG